MPSEFFLVDGLPRLPNGKVDRKSLPTLDRLPARMEESPSGNWSDLERSLANVWQETLNIETVGLDVRFFDVGGDSLSVIKVFNRLREITAKNVSITDVFKYQTIRSLAEFLGQ